jgi:hypothetical protein
MVCGANTVNCHQRRIQLSGSGPDDAVGVAEPRLRIARAKVPLTANIPAVSFLTIWHVGSWSNPAVTCIRPVHQLSGDQLPLTALRSEQVHSAAIKGRPSGRPASFQRKAASARAAAAASQLVFRLPRDHSVRFPDSAAFVAGSFQGFIGDFRPKLSQRPRCRLVRVPFGIIRSPRHLIRFP